MLTAQEARDLTKLKIEELKLSPYQLLERKIQEKINSAINSGMYHTGMNVDRFISREQTYAKHFKDILIRLTDELGYKYTFSDLTLYLDISWNI